MRACCRRSRCTRASISCRSRDRQRQRLRGRRRQRAPGRMRPHDRQGECRLPPGRADDGQLRCRLRHLVPRRPGRQEEGEGALVPEPQDQRQGGARDRPDQPRRVRTTSCARKPGPGRSRSPSGARSRSPRSRPRSAPATAASPGSRGSRTTCCCASISRARNRRSWARRSASAASPIRRSSATEAQAAMGHLLTLHDPQTARRHYEAGVWQADTFYTLLARHAAERPQAFAARDGARRLTYAELLRWVDAIADAFAEAGLRSGERVSLWLSNRLEALAAFLACARNGYVCNPSLHRNYRVEELAALLRYIDARALLIEDGWGADAERARRTAGAAQDLAAAAGAGAGARAARAGVQRPRPRPGRRQSRQGRLSRLHLGHDRRAQGGHALRQHAARQLSRSRARLAPRPRRPCS